MRSGSRRPVADSSARHVRGLKVLVRVVGEELAAEAVAAVLRHDRDADAAGLALRRVSGDLERILLDVAVLEVRVGAVLPLAEDVDVDAVDFEPRIGRSAAVRRQGGELIHPKRAAHPGGRGARAGAVHQLDAGNEGRHFDRSLPGRQAINHLARHDDLALDVLDVDQRRVPGHRDGLLDRADAKLGVDGRRESSGQDDAFAAYAGEPGQREADGVGPRRQRHDLELACSVGDRHPRFFDQGGTARFDGHPGQHTPGRVLHLAGNAGGALRQRDCRKCHHPRTEDKLQPEHRRPPEGLHQLARGCEMRRDHSASAGMPPCCFWGVL